MSWQFGNRSCRRTGGRPAAARWIGSRTRACSSSGTRRTTFRRSCRAWPLPSPLSHSRTPARDSIGTRRSCTRHKPNGRTRQSRCFGKGRCTRWLWRFNKQSEPQSKRRRIERYPSESFRPLPSKSKEGGHLPTGPSERQVTNAKSASMLAYLGQRRSRVGNSAARKEPEE